MSWVKNDKFRFGNNYREREQELKKLLQWEGSIYWEKVPEIIPEIMEILRSLYENKKALFCKHVETPWYKSDEKQISMDVSFEEGMKAENCVLYYASTEVLHNRFSEIRKKIVVEREGKEKREREEREEKLNNLFMKPTSVQTPSAPPQEQVEGC